jgi:hypothetical protein
MVGQFPDMTQAQRDAYEAVVAAQDAQAADDLFLDRHWLNPPAEYADVEARWLARMAPPDGALVAGWRVLWRAFGDRPPEALLDHLQDRFLALLGYAPQEPTPAEVAA